MFRVIPFQFEAVASHRLGNGGSNLVCDTFPDEVKGTFIGTYRVHGQRTAGVSDKHRSDARNYQNRLRVGKWHLLEPVEPVSYDVHPQRRIDGSDRERKSNHVKERDPPRSPLPKQKVTVA
jgi:hypothetical protein